MPAPLYYLIECRGDAPYFFADGKIHCDNTIPVLQDGLITDSWLFLKMLRQNAPRKKVGAKLWGQKIVVIISVPLYIHHSMKNIIFEASERLGAGESYLIFSASAYAAGEASLRQARFGVIDVGKLKTTLTLIDGQAIAAGDPTCLVLHMGSWHLEKFGAYGDQKTIFANALMAEAAKIFEPELPVRIIGETLAADLIASLEHGLSATFDPKYLEKISGGLQHIAANFPPPPAKKSIIREGSAEALAWGRLIRGE